MNIYYGLSNLAEGEFRETVEALATKPNARVCEIGAGANPTLPLSMVQRHALDYTIVDVSAEELSKAPEGYRKVCADISQVEHDVDGPFDLLFSKWCAEHVADGATFHRNAFRLLAPGGRAVHLFPTLYSPPFVLNRWFPEALSHRLLMLMQPHREDGGNHGKFPAYYRWCRGPTRRQICRFEAIGYDVESCYAYFGHSGRIAYGAGYLDRVPLLCRIHERICRDLILRPRSWLTSYAFYVLEKPMVTECETETSPEAVSGFEPTQEVAVSAAE